MRTSLLLISVFLLAAAHSGPASAEKPKECHTGPVMRYYGNTPWSVYSCGDDSSLLFVAMTGSPAAPFYFVIYLKDGGYQYDGEGTGSKSATDAAYLDLRRLTTADVSTLIAETKSVSSKAADPSAAAAHGPPGGVLPFTKEQNLDGSRWVWYVFQQSNLGYDYVPADALPASLSFREEATPRNGDVAWWPGYVAIVSMKDGEPMKFFTAEGTRGAAVMEAVYGKPRFYTGMNFSQCKDPQPITADDIAGAWAGVVGTDAVEVRYKADGTFSGSMGQGNAVSSRYSGTWKLDGHTLSESYTSGAGRATASHEVVYIGCRILVFRLPDGTTLKYKRLDE